MRTDCLGNRYRKKSLFENIVNGCRHGEIIFILSLLQSEYYWNSEVRNEIVTKYCPSDRRPLKYWDCAVGFTVK